MCRVSMWHVQEHRITQVNFESRLQLQPFQSYLAKRRLQWAGHLSCMPMSRLPCMLLSSCQVGWITNVHGNDHSSTMVTAFEGIFLTPALTSAYGARWQTTAVYGVLSLNKRMFIATSTAVDISGLIQSSWSKRLPSKLCHHRSHSLESCLVYCLRLMHPRLLSPYTPKSE